MTRHAKPSETREIRPARLADAAAIAEVHNQSIITGGSTMEDEPKAVEEVERRLVGLGPREGFWVLVDDEQVVGWGLIKQYSPRPGYRFACETAVYVDRQHLGQGVGSRLKKALIIRCKELGYHHMVAKIFASNVASIEYNKRLGYEVVGRQKEIGFKDGRWCDIVIMQLILTDVEPDGSVES